MSDPQTPPPPHPLPWRAVGAAAAANPTGPGAAYDLERLPPLRILGLRPLKRWTYAAVFGSELQLCVGLVEIAGAVQSFWAVHDRAMGTGGLYERTVRRRAVRVTPEGADFGHDGVRAEVEFLQDGEPVAVLSRHGGYPIWTRKTPVRAHGRVLLPGGDVRELAGEPGLLDESAGHHARRTAWYWSAGAGSTPDGRDVRWNLVSGIHDARSASERTVWVDGEAREVPAVEFSGDLTTVTGGGTELRFTAEAERARRDRLVVVDSAYRQPFGGYRGRLPGGIELTGGRGVMERHIARW
ncbi:DUF2804 family protein [Phaeacidiphilus oryzae]|uniref:DUF2804 family protein n=1 Tax=Phaeacidiphilus oryzae TaxID=348818 RepID=UPI00055FC555|nr:DUF2804 family protein [Phaeacidiphilus oryzae]